MSIHDKFSWRKKKKKIKPLLTGALFTHPLKLSMLGKKLSRQYFEKIVEIFFPENWI